VDSFKRSVTLTNIFWSMAILSPDKGMRIICRVLTMVYDRITESVDFVYLPEL
jgi:hypothetical protein